MQQQLHIGFNNGLPSQNSLQPSLSRLSLAGIELSQNSLQLSSSPLSSTGIDSVASSQSPRAVPGGVMCSMTLRAPVSSLRTSQFAGGIAQLHCRLVLPRILEGNFEVTYQEGHQNLYLTQCAFSLRALSNIAVNNPPWLAGDRRTEHSHSVKLRKPGV